MFHIPLIVTATLVATLAPAPLLLLTLLGLGLGLLATSQHKPSVNTEVDSGIGSEVRHGWLAHLRGCTLLMVCCAILAVDMPSVFPPQRAKTLLYGSSLMDVGTGALVYGQGLVALRRSRPLRAAAVLVLLGLARLFATRLAGLPVPPEEYGVHWNFFFTLALCTLLAEGMAALIKAQLVQERSQLVGLTLSATALLAAHHNTLYSFGLFDYIASAELRSASIWAANREGLASLAGYTALYLLGVCAHKAQPLAAPRLHMALLWGALCGLAWTVVPPSRRTVSGPIFD